MSAKTEKAILAKWWHDEESQELALTASGKPLPPIGWWKGDVLVGHFVRKIAEFGVLEYDKDDVEFTHDAYDERGLLVGEIARVDPITTNLGPSCQSEVPVAILGLVSLDGRSARYRMMPTGWDLKKKVNS